MTSVWVPVLTALSGLLVAVIGMGVYMVPYLKDWLVARLQEQTDEIHTHQTEATGQIVQTVAKQKADIVQRIDSQVKRQP